MRGHEGFSDTYYSTQEIIPLNLGLDFTTEEFRNGLAEGLRFIAAHEGPYLVHCTEGKDRAAFASAVLECLMGASADEVIADYMLTFFNYYGVQPGTEQYDVIARKNICKSLETAFGVTDIREADLRTEAETYLLEIGLSADEIAQVRARLGD
jgi:protein tyrosine/serine phosphatase